jgi:hypothetical protein
MGHPQLAPSFLVFRVALDGPLKGGDRLSRFLLLKPMPA